ncbi:MAG: hypothetical protein IPH37_18210 [Burkholderiales bacterium]|nr:hypothetical protein [Burkholderiales bacterium]
MSSLEMTFLCVATGCKTPPIRSGGSPLSACCWRHWHWWQQRRAPGLQQRPTLTYWWLDRYFDFDTLQAERVRADPRTLHDKHRSEALPAWPACCKPCAWGAPNDTSPEQCGLYTASAPMCAATLEAA